MPAPTARTMVPPREKTRNQTIKAIEVAKYLTGLTDATGQDVADHFRAIVDNHPDFARSVEKKIGISESSVTTWEMALTMIEKRLV